MSTSDEPRSGGDPSTLPTAARPLAVAVSRAVSVAVERDAEEFTDAVARLAALNPAQVGLVLGTLVRVLLEETHPDGLGADDVRAVLTRSVRSAAPWQPDVDPQTMLMLLADALGVHEPDGAPPAPGVIARHGALLAAELVGSRPVADCVTRAFVEIERAQLRD